MPVLAVVIVAVMLLVTILAYGYLVDVRRWRHETRAWWCAYLAAFVVAGLELALVTAVTR